MFLVAGCSRKDTNAPAAPSQPVVKSVEKGPVKLTVTLGQGEFFVGENVRLTIDVVAENGVAIKMPQLDKNLGAFEIADVSTPPDIPDGDRRRWTHRYSIRTLEAGPQSVPALTVTFADRRNAVEGTTVDESELTSPAIDVAVRSLLTGDFDPKNYRDIKGAVDIRTPWSIWTWLIAGAAFAVLALAVTIWLFMRRLSPVVAAEPPLPPHVWAIQELDRLAADKLLERGNLHEYFFRLSNIVRHYIERRFAIMAAEQTTEEFLPIAGRHPALSDMHRSLLKDFLRQADMVKFAKFQPLRHESEAAMQAARRFVEDTQGATGETTASNGHDPESPHHQVIKSPHAGAVA